MATVLEVLGNHHREQLQVVRVREHFLQDREQQRCQRERKREEGSCIYTHRSLAAAIHHEPS